MTTSGRPSVLLAGGQSRRHPHRGRRLQIGAGAFVALLIVLIIVASWVLSSVLINPHHDLVRNNIETITVRPGEVVLARTDASARVGVYGLDWPSGHAVVSDVIASTGSTVTRRLTTLTGHLAPHTQVGIDSDVWTGDPQSALHIPFRSVTFADPLGPMPAWLVPGRGTTWVIFVHGIDGTRAGGLRPLSTLHSLAPAHVADRLPKRRWCPGQPRRSHPPGDDRVGGPQRRRALGRQARRPAAGALR